MLEVSGITVKYGSLTLLDDVTFTVNEGEWLMICGPNGAGKSTLINAISQGVPYSGVVRVYGKDISKLKSSETARYIAVLAQTNTLGYAFTVDEIVRLGRYVHRKTFFSNLSEDADNAAITEAVSRVGMEPYLEQSALTLSGGELQRAFLAQVFAQNPNILMLDEPTNHLDLVYQQRVFELLKEWLTTKGRAVISVVHDLNLAKAYGTSILLLNKGRIAASGAPSEALSTKKLEQVYEMDVYAWMRSLLTLWE